MPDGDLRHPDPQSDRPVVGGLRLFQFSLLTLFVVTTAMALILAAYFSIGRWIGMSTMEVVTRGLVRFLYSAPTLLVWIVALTFAIRQRRRYRVPATLTIVALAGLIPTVFVTAIMQMVLIQLVESDRISHAFLGWSFAIIGVIYAVVHASGWVLILVAVFVRRTPDGLGGSHPQGTPFATSGNDPG